MSTLRIIDKPSPNFDARTRAIDLVVLHYTGMQDGEIALKRLCDASPVAGDYPGPWQRPEALADAPLGRASTHYVVAEDGLVYRLVAEEHRAWHAGASSWDGESDVNSRAIGIEIVNGGHDFGLPDYPDAQIEALIALLQDILPRWPSLHRARVVAHSDIAPERKQDPGEKFPWKRLAEADVSIWPTPLAVRHEVGEDRVGRVQGELALIGYGVEKSGAMDAQTRAALVAFQRRFRPEKMDGLIDDETQALLGAVSRMVRR